MWPTGRPGKSPAIVTRSAELHTVCSVAINQFRLLTLLLKPVVPQLAARAEKFLGIGALQWSDSATVLPAGHRINPYNTC